MKKLIFFVLLYFNLLLSLIAGITEDNFLKELYLAENNKKSESLYSPISIPDATFEQRNQFDLYEKSIPFYRKLFSAFIINVMQNVHSKKINELKKFYQNQTPVTPEILINYFKPLIDSNKLSFQNGDIICVTYHSELSYLLAYAINSPYEHADLIYINENNIPMVCVLMNGKVLNEVPLSEYLLGKPHLISRFAIYRYNKNDLDKDEMKYILYLIRKNSNNIYYDNAFLRRTSITEPEKFFSVPRFYYCAELVYAVYEYVLKNTGFDSMKYISLRECFKRSNVNKNTINNMILSYIVKEENVNNQKIIIPANFIYSGSFSAVATIGDTTPVDLSENS